MSAVGHILRSYFYRRPFILLLFGTAAYLLVIANAVMLSHPKAAWCFFLYALTSAGVITGFHLRQALEDHTADLLPNYRRCQLIAAGLLLALLLGWPLSLTGFMGGPVLHTLSAYLFFVSAALWVAFLSPLGQGLVAILGFPAIIWLLIELYELAGPATDSSWIVRLIGHAGPAWPVYTLLASALALVIFAWRFQTIRCTGLPHKATSDRLLALQTRDWTGPLANRSAARAIARLSETKPRHGSSLLRLVRLFEFSMFSPIYTLRFYGGGIFLYCAFTTYLSFHQEHRFGGPVMNFYLPSVYYFLTAALAADFLSHRDRWPAIYLRAALPSRVAFTRAAVLSYLLVVARQMLVVTMATVVLHLALPWTSWTHFPQLCVMGLILSLIQVSLSLLACERMRSLNGLGWLMVNILAIIPVVVLALLFSGDWPVIAGLGLFAGLLFYLAMRRWPDTELDFA